MNFPHLDLNFPMVPSSSRTPIYTASSFEGSSPSITPIRHLDKMPARMPPSPTGSPLKGFQPGRLDHPVRRTAGSSRRNVAGEAISGTDQTNPEIGESLVPDCPAL